MRDRSAEIRRAKRDAKLRAAIPPKTGAFLPQKPQRMIVDEGDYLVHIDDVCKLFGCCKRTIWRMVQAKQMPEPRGCGKASGWLKSQVESVQASVRRRRRDSAANRVRDEHGRFVHATE